MSNSLTSADCTIILTVTNLYTSGFNLEQFEAQNIFEMGDTEIAETIRTADNKLTGGYVNGDLPWTFHILPDSPSRNYIDTWFQTQRTAKALFRCNGTIYLPSLGKKYTMTNGIFKSWKAIPSAGRILQPMAGLIEWENIVGSDYAA
ncbi:phage tail fiber protein [Klebsiella quasipneumoniae]